MNGKQRKAIPPSGAKPAIAVVSACRAPRSSDSQAAQYQRRSRARKALKDDGYLLLRDVPLAPETLARLIHVGLLPASVAEHEGQLTLAVGALLLMCAEPAAAQALRRALDERRDRGA